MGITVDTTNYLLIKHLKTQSRHGMADKSFLDNFNKGLKELSNSGAQKYIKELGDGFDAFKESIMESKDYLTNSIEVLSANVSEYEKLSNGVGRALTLQDAYNKAVLAQIQSATYLETVNSKLNKSFGMSSERAYDFSKRLRDIGISFSDTSDAMSRGDADLMKYAGSLKNLTGGMIASSKATTANQKTLITGQSFLQDNIGLSETAAQSFELYAAGLGKSGIEASIGISAMAEALAGSTGLDATQLTSDILEGVSGLSSDIQAQYSRMPGNLELAVLKARALGTSMEKLSSVGNTLLNIESSIGSELEYQQLTGRRLLTDQGKSLTNEYRMATVRGDGAKQAALMAEFVEKEGDSLKNNMFARKKAAELFGVQESELLSMVNQRKLLAKYDMEDILKMSDVSEAEIIKKMEAKGAEQKDIEELFKLRDTRTTAERSEAYLESINSKILGKSQIAVSGTTTTSTSGKEFVAAMAQATKAPLDFANKMSTTFSDETFIKGLGAVGAMADKIKTVTDPVGTLTKLTPVLGAAINKLLDPIKTAAAIIPTQKQETPPAADNITKPTGGSGGRAIGGPVSAGSSYLVGERGPEIVTFKNAGKVTPTNQTKSMLNASSNINYAALGAAVAQALQSTPIYTTIVADNLYGSTSMNGKKRIG